MCVAIPGKVIWIGDRSETSIPALLDLGSHETSADLIMVPNAEVGDFVVAHSGYAVRMFDREGAEALRTQLGMGS